MEKKTEKAIRILIYAIIAIVVLKLLAFFFFPVAMGAIFLKLGEAVKGENAKIERRIDIENERKRNEMVMRNTEKIQKKNEIILAKPEQFQGTIFSWKDEKGNRIFSNTGFPKDGKYTDGKIEMQ